MHKVPVRKEIFVTCGGRIFHQKTSFRGNFADDLLEIEITTDNGREANYTHERQVEFNCS